MEPLHYSTAFLTLVSDTVTYTLVKGTYGDGYKTQTDTLKTIGSDMLITYHADCYLISLQNMTELTVGSQLARLLRHFDVSSAFRAPPRLTAPPSMHIRSCTRLLVNRDFDYDYDHFLPSPSLPSLP